MTDILEEREKRRDQALVAIKEVIEALKLHGFMSGKISLRGNALSPRKLELVIHLKPEDLFIWDEILFDGK